MHVAPPACPIPTAGQAGGRHRRLIIAPSRPRRTLELAGMVGSLLSLSALALLGLAVAAGLSAPSPAERPTITVTYDVGR